jgi:hypothetical protein
MKMPRKPAMKQLVKRLERAKEDLERGHVFAFDKVHKLLMDLGFTANYAELAAEDIADDYVNGLMEGEMPNVPIWLEDEEEEEEEIEEAEEEGEDE